MCNHDEGETCGRCEQSGAESLAESLIQASERPDSPVSPEALARLLCLADDMLAALPHVVRDAPYGRLQRPMPNGAPWQELERPVTIASQAIYEMSAGGHYNTPQAAYSVLFAHLEAHGQCY